MKKFQSYVDSLFEVFESAVTRKTSRCQVQIDAALDGQPSQELRRLIPLSALRSSGAFFTGSRLAKLAAKFLADRIGPGKIVVDPACGAGDLLIACTQYLPVRPSLRSTLRCWENCLAGVDIHPEFVDAAKIRLALAAARMFRSKLTTIPEVDSLFDGIICGDGLKLTEQLRTSSAIIINPPFSSVQSNENSTWARGKVNSAAMFLEYCLTEATAGTRLVAILPDVLRSGSRYANWRQIVGRRTRNQRLLLLDQFDKLTDVHVFIFAANIIGNTQVLNPRIWETASLLAKSKLADAFDISVGPVVEYRDPRRGPWRPFLVARSLPEWELVRDVSKRRRFQGRVIKPPFVVVRRTSRPEDAHRAIGTIITGAQPVAVENHLIVIRPKTGRLRDCRKLLDVLKSNATTNWLNRRIRCRHLTLAVIRELPWPNHQR